MWIMYAVLSSFFAGITSILAKCGIKETDTNIATAIRTGVVLVFSWFMVWITGTMTGINNIDFLRRTIDMEKSIGNDCNQCWHVADDNENRINA